MEYLQIFICFAIFLFVFGRIFGSSKKNETERNEGHDYTRIAEIANYVLTKKCTNRRVRECYITVKAKDVEKSDYNYFMIDSDKFKCPCHLMKCYALFVDIFPQNDGAYKVEVRVIYEHPISHRGMGAAFAKDYFVSAKEARKVA